MFWQQVHASTPAGAKILDIATGNGAIPRLLLRLRPDLDCAMTGIDIAKHAPPWWQALPASSAGRLHFRGGVDAEQLPFGDAGFDLVTSQYGIEYSHAERALAEVLRVRQAAGRIAFMLHHAQSRPVALAAVELEHLDRLQATDGLLMAMDAMIEPMARSATGAGREALARDATANAARQRFNAAQTALRAFVGDGDDVVAEVQDAVNQVLGLAVQQGEGVARQASAQLRAQLDDSRFRLRELKRCALDADALSAWAAALQRSGLRSRMSTVVEQGHLLGWTLVGEP